MSELTYTLPLTERELQTVCDALADHFADHRPAVVRFFRPRSVAVWDRQKRDLWPIFNKIDALEPIGTGGTGGTTTTEGA